MRVAFHPLTGGGSYFDTGDEKLQRAIESNANYGKSFIGMVMQEAPVAEPVEKPENKGPKQVKVTSLDDAKDYLAEKYGFSRTKLRSKSAILAAAEENGVEFIGI